MQMQRRHFELIARVISGSTIDKSAKIILALDFGRELRHTNPNFNVERFYRACGAENVE